MPTDTCCLDCRTKCKDDNCRDSVIMGSWCAKKAKKPVDGKAIRQASCIGHCGKFKPKKTS